jgi:hypothetical protein
VKNAFEVELGKYFVAIRKKKWSNKDSKRFDRDIDPEIGSSTSLKSAIVTEVPPFP